MGWTAPRTWATSELVTASMMNTHVRDELKYLKGQDGTISLEGNPVPSAATKTVGTSALPWGAGHFYALYAGPRYAVHKSVRTQTFLWNSKTTIDDDLDYYQVDKAGDVTIAGPGQVRLSVNGGSAGQAWFANQAEQNNGQDTSFNGNRNPYFKVELAYNDKANANISSFHGLRTTRNGTAMPLPAAESYAGLEWTGAIWTFQNSAGGGAGQFDTSGNMAAYITNNQRFVLEIFINGGVSVEYWIDGVLRYTSTTYVPTADMDWQHLGDSDGGGAGDVRITVGEQITQEDLS